MAFDDFRARMNENKLYAGIGIGVICLLAFLYMAWAMGWIGGQGGATAPKVVWYMVEETGELVPGPYDGIPPMPDPSGKGTLIRAHCYTLSTDDKKEILFLEKYSREGKAAEEMLRAGKEPPVGGQEALNRGNLVREPGAGKKWYYASSPEGDVIMRGAMLSEADRAKIRLVFPK